MELAVTVLYGKVFAETTYLLEGDQPLWSQVYDVMATLKSFITDGPNEDEWVVVKTASTKASELVHDLHEIEKEHVQMAEVEVRNAVAKLTRISSEFERVTDTIRSDTGIVEVINAPPSHQASTTMRVVRRANRSTRNQTPNRFRNGASLPRRRRRATRESRERAQELQQEKEKAQKDVDDANKILKKAQDQVHNRVKSADFEQYARTCVRRAIKYFKDKFEGDDMGRDAPLKTAMDIFCSARVCDPTVMINMSIEEIRTHLSFLCSIIPRERINEDELMEELEGTQIDSKYHCCYLF